MTWFVEPLERKDNRGEPSGLWHLCAKSDEGGGVYPGCEHDHPSAAAAQECEVAKRFIGRMTGFPETKAKDNQTSYDRGRRDILNAILALNPKAAQRLHMVSGTEESFSNHAGQLPFNVVFWVTEVAEQLGIEPKDDE